jgi:hypothetical protein
MDLLAKLRVSVAIPVGLLALTVVAPSASAGVVRGTVLLAPMCPGPRRQPQECEDMPIATKIDVFTSYPSNSEKPLLQVESNRRGQFQVALAPGTYWFIPHAPAIRKGVSFPQAMQVVVGKGVTTLTITVDTGLR